MPLHFAPGPGNGANLVLADLTRLSARGDDAPPPMHSIDMKSVQIQPPHAVFDLHADEIAQGGGLETAHGGATRYLVNAASGVVAAAEVSIDAKGTAILANINIGPYVAASAVALEQLARADRVKTGSFEARLLRCSAIAVVAIWLKPDRGNGDVIYPLAPAPNFLRAETTYTASEFLSLIRPAAQARIATTGPTTAP